MGLQSRMHAGDSRRQQLLWLRSYLGLLFSPTSCPSTKLYLKIWYNGLACGDFSDIGIQR